MWYASLCFRTCLIYNHEQVEDDKLIFLRLVKSSWPFYEFEDSLATSQLLSRWYYCNQSPFFLNGLDSSYKYLIKKQNIDMTNTEMMNMMVKNGVLEYGETNIYTHHMCCIYAASIRSGARSINRVN